MKKIPRRCFVVVLPLCCLIIFVAPVWSKDKEDNRKREPATRSQTKPRLVTDKDLIQIFRMRKIGTPAVPSLIAKLESKREVIRGSAAFALGQIGDRRAVQPLIARLKDDHWYVRDQAAKALGNIGDPLATESLVVAMKDPYVVRSAAEALGKIGDRRAVAPLIDMLDDELGFWAASALYQLNYQREKQLSRLLATLKSEDWRVRGQAALALGLTKDPRAVSPLIGALQDEDSRFRRNVIHALRQITGQKFNDDYEKWRNWWDRNKGTFQPEAVQHYMRGLEHSRLGRCEEAVKAFKQAIHIKADYEEAYYQLGSNYQRLGRHLAAVKAYKTAIQLKPDHAWAHYWLGIEYVTLADSEAARKECKILETLDRELASMLSKRIGE